MQLFDSDELEVLVCLKHQTDAPVVYGGLELTDDDDEIIEMYQNAVVELEKVEQIIGILLKIVGLFYVIELDDDELELTLLAIYDDIE